MGDGAVHTPPLVSSGLVVGIPSCSKVKGQRKYDLAGACAASSPAPVADLVDLVKLRLGWLVALTSWRSSSSASAARYKVAYADGAEGRDRREHDRHGAQAEAARNRRPRSIPRRPRRRTWPTADRCRPPRSTTARSSTDTSRARGAPGGVLLLVVRPRHRRARPAEATTPEISRRSRRGSRGINAAATVPLTAGTLDAKSQIGGIAQIGQGFDGAATAAAAQAQKESA